MALFIMLVGIPGSGKSFLAEKLVKENNAALISTDQLRRELTGSETDFTRDGRVFSEALRKIPELLIQGKNVVYDATNLTRADRKKVLRALPESITKRCFFRKVPLTTAIQRNLSRSRVVPPEIIAKMFQKLREPSMEEGWDEITVIE